MYYRMETDGLLLTTYIDKQSGPAIFKLTGGQMYTPKPNSLPFRFSIRDPDKLPVLDYIDGKCLMSRRLVETIEKAGAGNFQKFEAELQDEESKEINYNFYVVNIIGIVAAADMSKSTSIPLGEGHVFTNLTIEQNKTHGLLMFRLAESLVDVIVHERVAKAIEAGNFRGVLLSPITSE